MAKGIRCIFDAVTGCLIEYNTQRPLNDGEIEGYWNDVTYPDYGLIYDFSNNTVRPATEEEYLQCLQSQQDLTPGNARLISVLITLGTESQIIRRRQWTKISWQYASADDILDTTGTVRLTRGFWSIMCQISPRQTGTLRQLRLRFSLDGNTYIEKWYGGIYYQWKGVTYDILGHMLLTDANIHQFEVYVYSEKSITLVPDEHVTYLRLLNVNV